MQVGISELTWWFYAGGSLGLELVGIYRRDSGNEAGGCMQVRFWELSWWVYAGGNLGVDGHMKLGVRELSW